ncbi:FUSC family protein [Psychroflexus sp. CAK8W]|uniref:FUSC family protein n=1 Tax=Psychroflexus longus TaxID=2873596 RepID=A0ABS7XI73_9FLAO|nr:FUSC family membrane protein [Psychroflexus longus]MBZ9778435.1 FUSC family protein [Psychroflexus longus]
MKETIKQLELFFRSSNFGRGMRLGVALALPFVILYSLGYFEFALPIVVGAFLNAPGDMPGSRKRMVNATLISIGLTMLITAVILFTKPFLPLLLIAMGIITFSVSLLSVYGFRASLVSFSGLLAIVIAFAINKTTPFEILIQVALMGVGGLWYLSVSLLYQIIFPKKDQNQLLSDTLHLTGDYLKLRAKLLTNTKNRDKHLKQSFNLQNQINDKHETLREALLTVRKRSGRSRYEEKQLLIFLSSIKIFELIEAEQMNYETIDKTFEERKEFLKPAKELNNVMGEHLIRLSEVLIQHDPLPSKNELVTALDKTDDSIRNYIDKFKLPQAREGALILKNLYDYQEQLLEEITAIRRTMANVKEASKVSIKRQDASQFLTLHEYRFNVILQNLSLDSTLFRHSLRLSFAMLFAYSLGLFFEIQNTYWILLTIIVIMRPSYGLTKERSKDRIIGTIIGAVIAVGIVLLTQNQILYAVLALFSLIFAFALLQQNYKSAAALITISIVFVYSFINPKALEVIQFRVIDTFIGAVIAVVANYSLLPSWEVFNLKQVLIKALKSNKTYLHATQDLYQDPSNNSLAYNLARKDAFLAISQLNAAFQRLTQDPKSKQKEFQLIYEMVTLHQTLISATASIGNFIAQHQTTPASVEFNILIKRISNTLQEALDILEQTPSQDNITKIKADEAQKKLENEYKRLAHVRDENIKQGNEELNTETLHALQEAYLISNHLGWLVSLSDNLKRSTKKYNQTILRIE